MSPTAPLQQGRSPLEAATPPSARQAPILFATSPHQHYNTQVMDLVDFDLGLLIEHMKQPFSEAQARLERMPGDRLLALATGRCALFSCAQCVRDRSPVFLAAAEAAG